jgi:hypothetical protein
MPARTKRRSRPTRSPKDDAPCTAAGNRPAASLHAGRKALPGVCERQAIGHAAAGREAPPRRPDVCFHPTARIDDTIRDVDLPPVTEDERLLSPTPLKEFTSTDPWRVLRITGEFVEGFDRLASLDKAVTVFGSAARRGWGATSDFGRSVNLPRLSLLRAAEVSLRRPLVTTEEARLLLPAAIDATTSLHAIATERSGCSRTVLLPPCYHRIRTTPHSPRRAGGPWATSDVGVMIPSPGCRS